MKDSIMTCWTTEMPTTPNPKDAIFITQSILGEAIVQSGKSEQIPHNFQMALRQEKKRLEKIGVYLLNKKIYWKTKAFEVVPYILFYSVDKETRELLVLPHLRHAGDVPKVHHPLSLGIKVTLTGYISPVDKIIYVQRRSCKIEANIGFFVEIKETEPKDGEYLIAGIDFIDSEAQLKNGGPVIEEALSELTYV